MLPPALTEHPVPVGGVLVAIPVKAFAVAKARLADVLSPDKRERLGRTLAARAVATVAAAGAQPAVVTGDPAVTAWAQGRGVRVIPEPDPGGLNCAATAATTTALDAHQPWFILHADLPWLEPDELAGALAHVAAGRYVICPSYDGGTTGLGGPGPFVFRYGPASFHRHLAIMGGSAHTVFVSAGFALDIDSPADLARLLEL